MPWPDWNRFSARRPSRHEPRRAQPAFQHHDDGHAHPDGRAPCLRHARGPRQRRDRHRSSNERWPGCPATQRKASAQARKTNRPGRSTTLPSADAFWSALPTPMLQRFRSVVSRFTNHRSEFARRQAGHAFFVSAAANRRHVDDPRPHRLRHVGKPNEIRPAGRSYPAGLRWSQLSSFERLVPRILVPRILVPSVPQPSLRTDGLEAAGGKSGKAGLLLLRRRGAVDLEIR